MTNTLDMLGAILKRDYNLSPEALTPDASLDDLGIDSLGVAELLFNIEDEFKVTLPPDPVNLPTLGDVVNYIDKLIAAQRGQDALMDQAQIATINGPLSEAS